MPSIVTKALDVSVLAKEINLSHVRWPTSHRGCLSPLDLNAGEACEELRQPFNCIFVRADQVCETNCSHCPAFLANWRL
eukprot:s3312_g14.t1